MINKVVVFVLLLIPPSCAASSYVDADNYLTSQNYEMAAAEYMKVLKSNGTTDIRAMTGAFISYYMMKDYKKSFELCRNVLKLQAYHSAAILYAGLNAEALGDQKLAKNLLRYYAVLDASDPYRRFIKVRFDEFVLQHYRNNIQAEIQMEGRISTPQLSANKITVLYFTNQSEDINWDAFPKGFAQLLIHDLGQFKNLELTTREELQLLLSALQIDHNQLNQISLITRLGTLQKSRYVLSGDFSVESVSVCRMNTRLYDLLDPENSMNIDFNGKPEALFEFEKELVARILTAMDISTTVAEMKKIKNYQTKSTKAFLAYCEALNACDFNNYENASKYLTDALNSDPHFSAASELHDQVDALILFDEGKIASHHFDILKQTSYGGSGVDVSLTRERLNTISLNLDLGYLPGNDSRNGTGGIVIPDIKEVVKLGEPPRPPSN